MKDQSRTSSLLLLALFAITTHASESTLSQLEHASKDTPKGVPVTIDVWNATPEAELTLKLHGQSRLLGVEPAEQPAPWFKGVTFDNKTLTLKIPADAVPANAFSTLRLRAYMELGRDSGGRVALQKPLVLALNSAYGSATLQSGTFAFVVPSPPPTCVVAGCARTKECPDSANGDAQTCYAYYENFFCCSVNPHPSVD